MAKRKPVIWLVDDAFEASAASPAIIMVDISAVDPLMGMGSSLQATYSPIAKVADMRPGATIVIGSALPQHLVEDIAADVRKVVDNVVEVFEWVGGSQQFERAAAYLKALL